ncbi:MAG: uncharacterized protein A8A55_3581, partial [Amphiamblys sp. WSBS2006]
IKKIELRGNVTAIVRRPEIQEDGVLEELVLLAWEGRQVAQILTQEQKIRIGRIKKITLIYSAVSVLHKLEIQEGSVLEELVLSAYRREDIAPILTQEQKIRIGGIQKIKISGYAVAVLPKLEIQEDGLLEGLVLSTNLIYPIGSILN